MYTDYTTLDLSFLKNNGKESYDVIRSVGKMMAENQGRDIFHAPGFSIKVKGATFQGGLMIFRNKVGEYFIFRFNDEKHTVTPTPFVKDDQLITTIDRLINGFPMYIQQNKFNS